MKVGEQIVARVVEVQENGIYLRHEDYSGIVSVVELTWNETQRPVPEDFARAGDDLRLLVMTVHEHGFSGSLKRLRPGDDPRRLPVLTDGSVLNASVRAKRAFGVFVDLSIGLVATLEGCTHSFRDSLEVGQALRVIVSNVDKASGKLSVRLADEVDEKPS
ncbi:MAG: hypothetical protein AB8H86_19140 [Polyangiales bacterium]